MEISTSSWWKRLANVVRAPAYTTHRNKSDDDFVRHRMSFHSKHTVRDLLIGVIIGLLIMATHHVLFHPTPTARPVAVEMQTTHPSLSFCYANPMLRSMNRDTIDQLESTVWLRFHQTQIDRMYTVAHGLGRGVSVLMEHALSPLPFNMSADVRLGGKEVCGLTTGGMEVGSEMFGFPTSSPLPCPGGIQRFGEAENGARGDTGKLLCEIDLLDAWSRLSGRPCIIYSLGSNNQFDFEVAIVRQTQCQVFTFDCTSSPPLQKIPRVKFYKFCLGERDEETERGEYRSFASLLAINSHEAVHVLKMDIEGAEYSVFKALLTPTPQHLLVAGQSAFDPRLPYQISFETHYYHLSVGFALQQVAALRQLWYAGYRFTSMELNEQCPSCTEWTVMRVYC